MEVKLLIWHTRLWGSFVLTLFIFLPELKLIEQLSVFSKLLVKLQPYHHGIFETFLVLPVLFRTCQLQVVSYWPYRIWPSQPCVKGNPNVCVCMWCGCNTLWFPMLICLLTETCAVNLPKWALKSTWTSVTNLLTSGSNTYVCLLRNVGCEKKAITQTPVEHTVTLASSAISSTHSFCSHSRSPSATLCLPSCGPFYTGYFNFGPHDTCWFPLCMLKSFQCDLFGLDPWNIDLYPCGGTLKECSLKYRTSAH